MPANYVLLEKITVGAAGASSVTFSGIPQTGYTDLVLKTSTRNSGSNVGNFSAFTIAGAYNPNGLFVRGNGSVASSGNSQYGQMETGGGATASSFSNTETYFPNYTSAAYKSLSSDSAVENNATEGYNNLSAGVVANTSAITSLTITAATGTFVQYSTFYLYGVAKLGTTPAISPYATGGDTIMTDGTYWYHTFLSSGTFTPQKGLSCDYLVVAGGGGGGGNAAGGGGGGGLRSTVTATGGGGSLESALSLANGTGYTVTIGAGGAGSTGNTSAGTNGSNSVFATITSTGGGGGGTYDSVAGITGGSGGGGGARGASGTTTAGSGTANQGYAGGAGTYPDGTYFYAGGGGGAGAVGGTSSTATGASGGNGVATSISGSSVTYAGGGGAGVGATGTVGAGGTGGGGAGGKYNRAVVPTNGTANLGGGGGGGSPQPGGTGGSGIVIVRYAV